MERIPEEILASILGLVAPGTRLREAIHSILAAHTGALLVIGDVEKVASICNGGFDLDTPFEAERLFELSKMDGAIVLDEDYERILRANVHLVPDPKLPTSETGIRHRTAERVSRQTGALVIAISKRRAMITLYRAGHKLVLQEIETVLAKANQALQALQRYRTGLDEAVARLTALEFEDMVTLNAVVIVIQRSVAAIRVATELARLIVELGTEGRLVEMQADELMMLVKNDYRMLLRDYTHEKTGPRKTTSVYARLADLPQEQFLDSVAIVQVLGYDASADALESHVRPRGYRVLSRIPLLPSQVVDRIVDDFSDLRSLASATEEDLDDVDGVGQRRARAIREGLRRMREYSGF